MVINAGFTTALHAAEADLAAAQGTVMATGGGLTFEFEGSAQAAIQYGIGAMVVAGSARRKLVNLLNVQLAAKKIYVFEVTVMGAGGQATGDACFLGLCQRNAHKCNKIVFNQLLESE
jgi:hypothetical protein